MNNKDFQKAVELIDNSRNILIATHRRPDGDACGCVAAMAETLRGSGKNAEYFFITEVPEWYSFLFDRPPAVLGKDLTYQQLKAGELIQPDLIIIIDVNCNNQLPQFDEYLKQNQKPVLVIDHHVTNDGLGDVELIDSSAAAAAVIVFELFRYAGWPIPEKIATALFMAIATDTGWFQFNNTDGRALKICGDLIDAGANPTALYHNLYQNFSQQRFFLMIQMLKTLQLHFDDRYAEQHLTIADFKKTGAAFNDTEDLIDLCRRITTVEAAGLFVELENGDVKVSLRSRADVNVRDIAQKFGGGGHTRAAGINMSGPLEDAKRQILDEIGKQFNAQQGT